MKEPVLAGTEQWDVLALQVSRNVWTLVGIASFTAQSEIGRDRQPSVFDGNDVINLKRQQRNSCRDVAILATMLGALPDKVIKPSLHAKLTTIVQLA